MSSYFNYEIDEHRIRIQLKEHQVFFKEEAWNNYEKYVEKFRVRELETSKNLKFGINRNVILPIIFFVIILFFAFILYEFLSIKNNIPTKSNETPVNNEKIILPKQQQKNVIPIKKHKLIKDSILISNEIIGDTIFKNDTVIKKTENKNILLNNSGDTVSKKNNVKKVSRSKTAKKNKIEILNPVNIPSLLPLKTNENTEPELK